MSMTRRTFLKYSWSGIFSAFFAGCKSGEQHEKYTPEAADKILLSKTADGLRKVYENVQAFEIIRPSKNYLLGPYVYGFDGTNVYVHSKEGKYLFRMYERDIDGKKYIIQDFSKASLQNEYLTTGYDSDWRRWHMKEVNTLHKTENREMSITTNGVLETF
ncbi:MAG: hypothetical protein HZB65_02035 [Candidatus Aenigmarchaeota archaeon]|nr:hypothetical protein [Candidatus Aenigmarchaeota archaeon]